MKLIDVSLSEQEINLLRNQKGHRLKSFRCDPFSFNNWVYQRIGLFFDHSTMILKNEIHIADYYGTEEDVCWLEVCSADESEIVSGLENTQQIDIPLNELVSNILLVQENQRLYIHDELVYHVILTRGIVFSLSDGREVAFEKVDPFSEEIEIRRGSNLVNTFKVKIDPDEWDDDSEMRVTQEIICL